MDVRRVITLERRTLLSGMLGLFYCPVSRVPKCAHCTKICWAALMNCTFSICSILILKKKTGHLGGLVG